MQYEGELAVVIGKQAKHLSEAEALSCVLGYSIGNDVSERTWQKSDRTLWRAKNADTFKPDGAPDRDRGRSRCPGDAACVSAGSKPRAFATNDMLFGVAAYISAITRYITLVPRRHHLDGHRRHARRT